VFSFFENGLDDAINHFVFCEEKIMERYVDEEVVSSYGYLSGYTDNRNNSIDLIISDFEKETKILDGHFNCGTKFNSDWIVRAHNILPIWVEKFFAQFPWQYIAPTYGEAVQKVLDLIKQTRNGAFCNYREGKLGPNQLRQSAKSVSIFQKLGDEQKDQDILVVPVQFGIRHRGRSVRRAREVMNANECGLGAFTIGIMLLTHPERLNHYDDLWIDCAGDEFAPDADGGFSRSPYFKFRAGKVGFDADDVGNAHDGCGSASVCLPQG